METSEAGALLRRVAQMHTQLQRDGIDSCCGGATATQCMILTELGRTGPITMADLVRRVNLDKGWISRAVESMAQEGLLTKAPSPTDRRAVVVCMTETGESLCCGLNLTLDSQSERVMSRIPPAERENVYRALSLLEQALREEMEGRPVLIRLEEE